MANNRQSETRSSRLPASGAVDAVEALGDSVEVTRRDANTLVGHLDLEHFPDHSRGQPNRASIVAVLHRIVEEVDEDLLEPGRVTHELGRGGGGG